MVPAQARPIHHFVAAVLFLASLTIPTLVTAQRPSPARSGSFQPVPARLMIVEPTTDEPGMAATTSSPVAAPPFTTAAVAGVHTMATADALALAEERAESVGPEALVRRARAQNDHGKVLMIVGGAALVLGLVTDGAASDILIIGGAGVGLFGLYRFLQ